MVDIILLIQSISSLGSINISFLLISFTTVVMFHGFINWKCHLAELLLFFTIKDILCLLKIEPDYLFLCLFILKNKTLKLWQVS